jgi:transposase InsO family protein
MHEDGKIPTDKEERRLQAVLALLQGQPATHVQHQYHLCRSDLYKFKRRALAALRTAIADHKKGPRTPANKLSVEKEQQLHAVCERYPTWSSYQIHRHMGPEAPCPRTIQRVRKHNGLARVPKRPLPRQPRKRFSPEEQHLIRETVQTKLYLGPLRLAWDVQNQHGFRISASTVRRVEQRILTTLHPPPALITWHRYEREHPHSLWHGDLLEKVALTYEHRTACQLTLLDDYSRAYVFCDLFRTVNANTTICALIAAMRAYRTIPKAVVCDNALYFKGKLLTTFCQRLGIELMHSAVYHPQTNGKLERAFRDDMNEFYCQRPKWIFKELQHALPAYVAYRNQIRGHSVLGGQPAITRLREQHFFALPTVLDRLERYAWCDRGQRVVGANGYLRFQKRTVYAPSRLSGQTLQLYETLDGLEAQAADGKCYLLRHYRTAICPPWWTAKEWRRTYYFRPMSSSRRGELPPGMPNTAAAIKPAEQCSSSATGRARIAVAYSQ